MAHVLWGLFAGFSITYAALIFTALFGSQKWSDRVMRLITSHPGQALRPRGKHRWWPWGR